MVSVCGMSCDDCPRDGCDALETPAAQGSTGIAGVVAYEEDVVNNGCQECPFGEATIELWKLSTAVDSKPAAVAVVQGREPDTTLRVSRHYRRELEPGDYLMCAAPNCIGVKVTANETVTVNIKTRYGKTGFFVGSRSTTGLDEEFGFDMGDLEF
jgi:hypothetical protein